MASSWMQSITIGIAGDTSALQKSLREVNASLRATDNELKATNKLLNLDPTNTELVSQKMSLLETSIKETTDKLNGLKKAKDEFDKNPNDRTEEQQKRYRELTREIASTEQKLKQLQSTNEDVGDSFDDVSTSTLKFGDVLKANILSDFVTTGLKTIANLVVDVAKNIGDFVKEGVEYNAQMETYEKSFTAMLGSVESAQEAIDKIRETASYSPFSVEALVKSNQALLTTGETAERSEKVIRALGDAVAYTGGGNDELSRMATNLQQVRNVGKATSTDIKQFAMAGIDIYGILGDYLGKNVEQLKDMDIGYEDLTNALINASEEGGKYFGAMENQSETFNGQLGQLKSNFDELKGMVAEDLTKSLETGLLPSINDVVTAMKEGFGENGVEGLLNHLMDAIDEERISEFVERLVTNLDDNVIKIGGKILEIGAKIGKAVIKGIWEGIKNNAKQYFGEGTILGDFFGFGQLDNYAALGGNVLRNRLMMQSGGFGNVTLNSNITFQTNAELNEKTANEFASWIVNDINKQLGGMV